MNSKKSLHNSFQTISKSIKSSLIMMVGAFFAFGFQVAQARIYGAEAVGVVTLGFTIVTILSVVLVLGINQYIIREIPRDQSQLKPYVFTVFKFELTLTLIIGIILLFYSKSLEFYFNKPGLSEILKLFSILLIINVGNIFLKSFLISIGKTPLDSFIDSIGVRFMKFLFMIVFSIIFSKEPFLLAMSYVASSFIGTALKVNSIRKSIKMDTTENNKSISLKNTIIKSFPFFLVSTIYFLIVQVDKLFIGKYLDLKELGIFSIASNTAAFTSLFSAGFIAFWPRISKLYNEKRIEDISTGYRDGVRIVLIFSTPFVSWAIINTQDIMQIFGPEYISGSLALSILFIGIYIDTVAGPVGAILLMTKYTWIDALNGFIGLLISIILNLILIPKMGIIGAALATSISLGIINIIKVFEVFFLLKIKGFVLMDLIFILSIPINYLIYNFVHVESYLIGLILTLIISYTLNGIIYYKMGIIPRNIISIISKLIKG